MTRRALGWIAVAALALGAGLTRPESQPDPIAPAARFLGPLRHAIADGLWLRAESARRRGRHDLVISRSLAALALTPESTNGWDALAHQQALVLGSTLREPDAGRRAAWLRAGLETAQAGRAHAEHPEELAFLAGILLQTHAENDLDSAWPGGTRGLWEAAAAEYEEAAHHGRAQAAEMARTARARAADPSQ